jgi:RNA recognition motif-containing protein
MIYSAFERIALSDITVSFVIAPKPTRVFKELAKARGLAVEEAHRGIYYIKGDVFPIQIIESKRLTAKENIFLKNLRSGLTPKDIENVFDAYTKHRNIEKVNVYLNRLFSANIKVVEEVMNMYGMSDELVEVITNYMVKTGKLQKIAINMLNKGYAVDEVADNLEMPIEWVQGVAEQTLVTA